ncbi:transposase [Escherichia coli]|nr:transposase [Escherichia coli]
MGSCAAPSAKGDDKFITTDYLQQCRSAELRRVATGMEADVAAICEAISSRWSNGVVEGHVNRLKMLKRQMYGRAGFELLRQRVMSPLA